MPDIRKVILTIILVLIGVIIINILLTYTPFKGYEEIIDILVIALGVIYLFF